MARRIPHIIPVMTPIKSAPVASLSTPALVTALQNVKNNQVRLSDAIASANDIQRQIVKKDRSRRRLERFSFLGNRVRSRAALRAEEQLRLEMDHVEAQETVDQARAGTSLDLGDADSPAYQRLTAAFDSLAQSQKIWDVTDVGGRDHYRSPGSSTVNRQPVSLGRKSKQDLCATTQALAMGNANGGDLLFYPTALIVDDWRLNQIALIDLREVHVRYTPTRFVEDDRPPTDATRVGTTWQYVRNDGLPDRRFANNRELPVMQYGQLSVVSKNGLNEEYKFSCDWRAAEFAQAYMEYTSRLSLSRRA